MDDTTLQAYTELTEGIGAGYFDDKIEELLSIVRARRDELDHLKGMQKKFSLKRGQPVWFNERTHPLYLRGHKAIVDEINRTRIVVRLEQPVGRFYGKITTSLDLISLTPPS
jgi:hypothetical protein